MSNPQDPQQPFGDSPQDPGNPQNPYGDQPGSQPPVTPQPSEPQYGQPQPGQPQYGQPQYGQPQYGQPQYGQPQYGQPQAGQQYPQPGQPYPSGTASQEPSKGMAIASLVLSFIACTIIAGIISIVLAIIVLRKGKDGRNHGKGFAIAGLIISTLSILTMIGLIAFGAILGSSLKDVNDLKTGDCVNINNFEGNEFESLEIAKCAEKHDAEVLATVKLTEEQASGYEGARGSDLCNEALPVEELPTRENLELLFLTDLAEPKTGDTLACLARDADGAKLTGKLE